MKKLAIVLLLIPALSFAQVEETQTGKVSLGNDTKNFFIKDGEGFKLKEYKEVFSNQEAIDRIKKAKTNKTFAEIITYTGSFGLGYGLGYVLSVKNDNPFKEHNRKTGWIIAGCGAGVLISSVPLWNAYVKNIKKGVELENESEDKHSAQLNLNVNGNGFGLAYQF